MVLGLHGAALYALGSVRVNLQPAEAVPVFVTLISPSAPPTGQAAAAPTGRPPPVPPEPIKRQAPRGAEPPRARLAVEAPTASPAETTEPEGAPRAMDGAADDGLPDLPSAPPDAGLAGVPSTLPGAAGPVGLTSELALVCPVRTPPPYPPVSRRLGETGRVVLRVELDETGRVTAAHVISSSGHPRLDAAALAAVGAWRCEPARRDGRPVRSVAVQPFDFTLQGR